MHKLLTTITFLTLLLGYNISTEAFPDDKNRKNLGSIEQNYQLTKPNPSCIKLEKTILKTIPEILPLKDIFLLNLVSNESIFFRTPFEFSTYLFRSISTHYEALSNPKSEDVSFINHNGDLSCNIKIGDKYFNIFRRSYIGYINSGESGEFVIPSPIFTASIETQQKNHEDITISGNSVILNYESKEIDAPMVNYLNAQYLTEFAEELSQKREFNDSESILRIALSIEPEFSAAYFNLAWTLKYQNKIREAENAFKASIKYDELFEEAYVGLARIYRGQKRLLEIESLYRKAVSKNPDNGTLSENLGRVLKDLEKFQQSKVYYQKALKLQPKASYFTYCELGLVLAHLNRFNEAKQLFRSKIEEMPQNLYLRRYYAEVLIMSKDYIEAEKQYRKAIDIEPKRAYLYFNLGKILEKINRIEEAKNNYRKAIQIDPEHSQAIFALENLL